MAFSSPTEKKGLITSNVESSGDAKGLSLDLHCDTYGGNGLQAPCPSQIMSAKEFVSSVCESPGLAAVLPLEMTVRQFSNMDAETILHLAGKDFPNPSIVSFSIELAKQHLHQCDNYPHTSSTLASVRTSPHPIVSAPISPRPSLGSQLETVPPSAAAGAVNPQSARLNPLTRMFLRRTFSENTRRHRAPSCNLGASAGSSLLRTAGLGQKSPGLPHCSFGHELSNLVRLGGSAFGQSAPCLLSPRDAEANREFLSSGHGGRLRSATVRRSSHASGGPLGSARNDSTASTATSPMESPKPFGQSGHFASSLGRYSNGHRRWSVASLPGSSGYATEPGVGSDGTSSIYTSNEGLPSPSLGGPSGTAAASSSSGTRHRHHTTSLSPSLNSGACAAPSSLSLGAANSGSLLSPRASGTSAFSSSDSNPVFEMAPELSPITRTRLARKHSTPSLCSLADDDVAILNSVYQECFPRAQRIMEDRLRSLIAAEQANPIGMPESMDGAFCFVHDQALQLAADCLRASEQNQLSAAQFANLSTNLGQLAKQAKQKCPLSAQKLHRIIINILMAIARCARLCECLEFSPETFNRVSLDSHLENPSQGIISQVQADVYRYVIEQLGDLVSASGVGLVGVEDAIFNTSGRLNSNSTPAAAGAPKTPSTFGAIVAPTEDDFEVVKNISNGAYGAVFLVRQKKTGQRFAMKRINKRCLALHNQCEQIWAERNILTFADNPFVVQMYCSFETPKHFCMVMEYVQGGDVASLLKKVRTIPVDLARVYFAEIVLALAYLHSYGIIHRDIKPDNLLITATGHIKLTDFGLSKIGLMNRTTHLYVTADPGSGGASATTERLFKDKQVYGTPQYIAPEVILGQDYGKAVDWWSVGVVLYECLLGITPFYGSTPQEVFQMIVYHDAIEWPDPEDSLYPMDDSRDIIESLLQNDPDARLGSGPGGAADVKAHSFFDCVEWTSVLWQKAEMLFVPQLDDEEDTAYFDSRSDRYSHDDTEGDEAIQADTVFQPASPYEGNSPRIRSRVGSVVEPVLKSGDKYSAESTLLPPSNDATLAASTTPPMGMDQMFQSFCSFSPRYARDSLSLISSGESSPLLASSLSAADLTSARSRAFDSGSPEAISASVPNATGNISSTSAASLPSVIGDSLAASSSSNNSNNSRPVPVISVNSGASQQTPPSAAVAPNILSMAAAQVAATQAERVRRSRNSAIPVQQQQTCQSSKPLSLMIPHSQHSGLTHSSSSPLSGGGGSNNEQRRTSGGSDASSSSLSPLSPSSFAMPVACPTSVTIKRGPRGFGFTFRTIRIREHVPAGTPGALRTPRSFVKSRLQHQILSVQTNSPAAAAGLQPGHVIMAINDGSVDGHSHIDVLTRLVASKDEVRVYTCEPEAANFIRATPTVNFSTSRSKKLMMSCRGPTTTPASTMGHRKSFDPTKARTTLSRHASMSASTPEPRSPDVSNCSSNASSGGLLNSNNINNNNNNSNSDTNINTIASDLPVQPQVPQVKLTSASGRPHSSSLSRPSLNSSRLTSSFSGCPGGVVKMQRALSQTLLPMGSCHNRRLPSNSTTPNRPQQLLSLPTTTPTAGCGAVSGGGGGGNLLSSSLPHGALSHALSSALGPHTRPRGVRQLSHSHTHQQQHAALAASSLHPSKADHQHGGTAVSRRRSFHTMPSPLARTPSPLTGSSPTAGNSLLTACSGGAPVNVTASLPITPISPQRACSPLVQEPGGSLRMRNISNRRVQSVYVPHYSIVDSNTLTEGQFEARELPASDSSSSASLPVDYPGCDDASSSGGNSNREDYLLERKSESAVPSANCTPSLSAPLVRRRLTTDDGTWPESTLCPTGGDKNQFNIDGGETNI